MPDNKVQKQQYETATIIYYNRDPFITTEIIYKQNLDSLLDETSLMPGNLAVPNWISQGQKILCQSLLGFDQLYSI